MRKTIHNNHNIKNLNILSSSNDSSSSNSPLSSSSSTIQNQNSSSSSSSSSSANIEQQLSSTIIQSTKMNQNSAQNSGNSDHTNGNNLMVADLQLSTPTSTISTVTNNEHFQGSDSPKLPSSVTSTSTLDSSLTSSISSINRHNAASIKPNTSNISNCQQQQQHVPRPGSSSWACYVPVGSEDNSLITTSGHHRRSDSQSSSPLTIVPPLSGCGSLWNPKLSQSSLSTTTATGMNTPPPPKALIITNQTAATKANTNLLSTSSSSSMILAPQSSQSGSQSSSLSSLLQHHHHQSNQSSQHQSNISVSSSLIDYVEDYDVMMMHAANVAASSSSPSTTTTTTGATSHEPNHSHHQSTSHAVGDVQHHHLVHHQPYSSYSSTTYLSHALRQSSHHSQIVGYGSASSNNIIGKDKTIYEIPSVLLNCLSTSSNSSTNAVAAAAMASAVAVATGGGGGGGGGSAAVSTSSTNNNNTNHHHNHPHHHLYRSGSNHHHSVSHHNNKPSSSSSYVAPRNEYESLIKRYAELDSFHVEVVTKLSMTEAENRQHRKRNEEILQQLNQAMNARETLQDELNIIGSKYDKACRDIHNLQDQLNKVKKQRDEANKECQNAMTGRNKANRERQQMYEERNIAIKEYNLIMSERDSVHKEIEKLQEDLQDLQKRNDTLEKEYKMTQEELESLRRELASALLDRDRVLKTCNDLREKYGESSLTSHHSQNSFNLYSQLPFQQQDSQQSLQQSSVDGHIGPEHMLTNSNSMQNTTVNNNNCSSSSNGSLIGTGIINQNQSPATVAGSGGASSTLANLKNLSLISKSNTNPTNITTSSSTSSVSTFGAPQTSNICCTGVGQSSTIGIHHHHQQQHSTPLINNKTSSITAFIGDGNTNASNNSLSHNNNLVNQNENDSNLREQIKQLQVDLQKATQEIETWKIRRDWAINERDKIVLERESVRALCDKLRRERDRKNSDLADALRESYEIKRQKNEATKELESLKEKFDSAMKANKSNNNNNNNSNHSEANAACQTNGEQQQQQNVAPTGITCTSQDSAIDVDDVANGNNSSNYFEQTESLFHIQLKRDSTNIDWGFELAIQQSSIIDFNSSIVVTNVSMNSIVFNSGLKVFDQILQINDLHLTDDDVNKLATHLNNAQSLINDELHLNLKIRRLRKTLQTISLPIINNENDFNQDDCMKRMFGFNADLALIINQMANIETNNNNSTGILLSTGDRIISINGTSLNKILSHHLLQYMFKSADNHSNTVKVQMIKTMHKTNNSLTGKEVHNQQCSPSTSSKTEQTIEQSTNKSTSPQYHHDSNTSNDEDKNVDSVDTTTATMDLKEIIHTTHQQQQTDSEIDDEDEPRATVDEDNDADEDDSNSDKDNDDPEVPKTIVKFDQMLEKYQIEDFYSSNQQQSSQEQKNEFQIAKNHDNSKDVQPTSSSSSVVRRSSRSKKNKQRGTLAAANQFSGAVHEFADILITNSSNNNNGSGVTWPRYRPHQFLSAMLPSFYKKHGNELQKNYFKQQQQEDKRQPLINLDNTIINNYATTTINRRKQRKSLGVFLDIFPTADLLKSTTARASLSANNNNNNQNAVSNSLVTPHPVDQSTGTSSALIDTSSTVSSHRRSPRHREHSNSLNYEALYGQRLLNSSISGTVMNNALKTYSNSLTTSSTTRPLSYDHKILQAAMLNYCQQAQPQHVMFQSTNQTTSSTSGASAVASGGHYLPYHLDNTQKTSQLQRSLTYNSCLKNNRLNYLMGQQQHSDTKANNNYYYQQQQQLNEHQSSIGNTYSSLYPTYSSVKDIKSSPSGLGQSSQVIPSTNNQSSTQNSELYGSHYGTTHSAHPQTQLVDYSVVSAQSQDKNLLKYYKMRQASTLINQNNGTGTSAVVTSAQQQSSPSQQQQQSVRVQHHSLSQPFSNGSTGNGDHSGVNSQSTTPLYDLYGQTVCQTKRPEKIYSTIGIGGSIRNSLPVSTTLSANLSSLGSSSVSLSSNYYNLSSTLSNVGIPHSHLAPAATVTAGANASSGGSPSNSQSSRHSMNLNLNPSTLQVILPKRDSFMLTAANVSGANSNNGNNNDGNSWDNDLSSCSSSVSNSAKPTTGIDTSISVPSSVAINRSLYKDSFNYPSIYDNSSLSARASISNTRGATSAAAVVAAAAAARRHYSLSENIYGSNKNSQLMNIQQVPPPTPPSHRIYSTTNGSTSAASVGDDHHLHHQLLLTSGHNFQDDTALAQAMLSRSQRLRISSNSSSTTVSSKNNPKTLFFDKSFAITPHATTAAAIALPVMSPNLGPIGDRNSYVSNSGTTGPQIKVEWIKCSKDGSPGSPILDLRKAKPDDYRLISIHRSSASLGIRILRTLNDQKGVFVEAVTEGSLADQAGIRVGDQIIEICGVNMRAADFENSSKVLNECRDPIYMLVQKNYDKFKETQIKQHQMITNTAATLDREAAAAVSVSATNRTFKTNDLGVPDTNTTSRVRMPIVGREDDLDNVIDSETSENSMLIYTT